METIDVKFSDYLPNPLKNMAGLTEQVRLVKDIDDSSHYAKDFPILDKREDFLEMWELVSANISENYALTEDPELFLSHWNFFQMQMYSNIQAFTTLDELTTVPRTLTERWAELYPQLRPITSTLHFTEVEFLDYLNTVLNPSKKNLWEDFTDTLEDVYQDYVLDQTEELANIRSIGAETDAKVINLTARMLGFNFRDEVLDAIGKERVAALIPMVGQFYEVASSDDFIKLIEMTVGAKVIMEHLYSKDYVNFKTKEEYLLRKATALTEESKENDWFKTTHINLYIEYGKSRYLATKISAPLRDTLMEIIEHFIPANLVLKNFGLTYQLNAVEDAPSVYFSAAIGTTKTMHTIGQLSDIQTLPDPDPNLSEMLFDNEEAILAYIDRLTNNDPKLIFDTWGRFSGAKWFPAGTTPLGEADAWKLIDGNITCTANTVETVGFISPARTEKFQFEATLSSANKDDDAISLVAAFDYLYNEIVAIHFTRKNYKTANWCAYIQRGSKFTLLKDGSNAVTSGFQNPEKLGWHESGPTRIRIERDGDIIKAWTSRFGSEEIDQSTQILINVRSNALTVPLVTHRYYGYSANSQDQAKFSNVMLDGEFAEAFLYDIKGNKRFFFDPISGDWSSETMPFSRVSSPKRVYQNPATGNYYGTNAKGVPRRIS